MGGAGVGLKSSPNCKGEREWKGGKMRLLKSKRRCSRGWASQSRRQCEGESLGVFYIFRDAETS